jgi:antitoxin HigA-1
MAIGASLSHLKATMPFWLITKIITEGD